MTPYRAQTFVIIVNPYANESKRQKVGMDIGKAHAQH